MFCVSGSVIRRLPIVFLLLAGCAAEPPAELDWDMWLGPRPLRPFQATIAPYKFRWWHLYSSQTANNGVHYLDTIRWLNADLAPVSICAMGGRYAVDDDRTRSQRRDTIGIRCGGFD